jgi:hypothetical protein
MPVKNQKKKMRENTKVALIGAIAIIAAAIITGIFTLIKRPSPPPPTISISEPIQTVECSPIDLCVFPVRGTSKNIAAISQTIVIFIDPGGGNWWPQNLDFPVTIQSSEAWEGMAQLGDTPQPSGTEFRVFALLMNQNQVPTEKRPYKVLPPSITVFGPIPHCCKVK